MSALISTPSPPALFALWTLQLPDPAAVPAFAWLGKLADEEPLSSALFTVDLS